MTGLQSLQTVINHVFLLCVAMCFYVFLSNQAKGNKAHFRLMYGSILPVTIPSPGNPGDKSSPSGPGVGKNFRSGLVSGVGGGAN